MKVLHICSSDLVGGAAQSAYSLHRALLNAGADSVFFAAEKQRKTDRTVITFSNGAFWRRALGRIDAFFLRKYPRRTLSYPFSTNYFRFTGLAKHIRKIRPDVVHLHWIGKGLLQLEHLARLGIPVVWTLHDNYAFTGGCHLAFECERYCRHCGNCPQLASGNEKDLSHFNFERKKRLFPNIRMTFVAPSAWMEQKARESVLAGSAPVRRIPNVIDPSLFYPVLKAESRKNLALSEDRKIVLFGAVDATSDPNKGFSQLVDALKLLDPSKFELLVFGSSGAAALSVPFKVRYLGFVTDIETKRMMYAAADVTVVPSRIENLSNVVLESLACGTPVVAFDTGGNSDMISHQENGYLAEPGNAASLSEGISWVAENKEYDALSAAARQKTESAFSVQAVVNDHLDLYTEITR